MDYGFFMDFQPKSLWIMDFLCNGYGFRILKNMDYGMDMDSVLNPSGPTVWYNSTNRKWINYPFLHGYPQKHSLDIRRSGLIGPLRI